MPDDELATLREAVRQLQLDVHALNEFRRLREGAIERMRERVEGHERLMWGFGGVVAFASFVLPLILFYLSRK